jgi:hypothetical protein
MKPLTPANPNYPGKHVKIATRDSALDFATAKDTAKQKAQEMCADPMLLSWYNGQTGESYPICTFLLLKANTFISSVVTPIKSITLYDNASFHGGGIQKQKKATR